MESPSEFAEQASGGHRAEHRDCGSLQPRKAPRPPCSTPALPGPHAPSLACSASGGLRAAALDLPALPPLPPASPVSGLV